MTARGPAARRDDISQPALGALAETVARVSRATEALIHRLEGGQLRLIARHGARRLATTAGVARAVSRGSIHGQAVLERKTTRGDAAVATPMVRDGALVGVITIRRAKARQFSASEIRLLEALAAQAAIVVQELEAHGRERAESREQQAAAARILRTISTSTADMQPVFDLIAENAVRLCRGQFGGVFQFDGERVHLLAQHGLTREGGHVYAQSFPRPPGRDSAIGRAILNRTIAHIPDVQADPAYGLTALARAGTMRCIVAVPVLRESHPIGGIVAWRSKPERFSDTQIELLKTFADQALIAIENVRLFKELEAKNRDLTETLEQQTATGEILRVISSSPTDVQPVFDTITQSAKRLCAAQFCLLYRFDGRLLHFVAYDGLSPEALEAVRRVYPMAPSRGSVAARSVLSGAVEQIPDVDADPDYRQATVARAIGAKSNVGVPMVRDGVPIGTIVVARVETGELPDRQIELLKTFADQAVIAIENVRLFTELEAKNRDLTETLEQQTATSEILRVISSSPTDVQPVFDTIAQSAKRLCEAQFCHVYRFDGQRLHFVAHHGLTREGVEVMLRAFPMAPNRRSAAGRSVLKRAIEHIPDVDSDPDYGMSAVAKVITFRSTLAVPMLREGLPVGVITVSRSLAGSFPERQVELLKTFADQAVIAIENVRLFTELEARNRALTETLEQQTATGEILRVISSSPTDVQPVFDTIARSAAQLCEAQFCHLFRFDGALLHFVAHHGLTPEGVEAFRRSFPIAPDRGSSGGRAALSGAVQHIPDVHADPDYRFGALAQITSFRSIVAVPMVREGRVIGTINVARLHAGPFPDRYLELLKTFADQAVIAVENVRLFKELDVRNRDLTETLEQQTATGEILRVISSSPTDVQPVFDAIAEAAMRLCGAASSIVTTFDGELMHLSAQAQISPEGAEVFRRVYPRQPSRGFASGRAVLTRSIVHIDDALTDREYEHRDLAHAAAFRGILAVPMLRDGLPIGTINVHKTKPGLFTDKQVELLKTFADQAVIAIQNVRLFTELEARNAEMTETLARQTATGEVLRAISRAQTDAQPVFDIIAASALRLCGGGHSGVWLYDGQQLHVAALDNVTPEGAAAIRRAYPLPADPRSTTGRAILARAVVQVPDVLEDPAYGLTSPARTVGFRSFLAAPMLRDGVPIGVIGVGRPEPGSFPDTQVELLRTFADQAVIAIENVRLFKELEARTQDLTRSVRELQALGEVSQAVNSTLELETILATIVRRAVELSEAAGGAIYGYDEASEEFRLQASHRMEEELLAILRASPLRLGEGTTGQAALRREPIEVADISDPSQYGATRIRAVLVKRGYRSLLSVPLLQDQRILGALTIWRREAGRFPEEVVNLLRTLATQSTLAIHNAGLFREIQRQKQYADSLVETSPVAIVTVDLAGTVVSWNPGAERLFGYARAEALGRPMEDLVATVEAREEIRTNIRRTLGGEWIRGIGRRMRKGGTLVDVEISSVPLAAEGAPAGMIAIYHDITDLLRARREAEAANEAKSAFLATMSHEIRTPMNAVIGMSGLLLNTALTDEQREYAEIVRQSGDALLTVINDILDFSKIEAGKLELESQPFDLLECIEGALDLVASRAAEKGLDLAYLVSDGTPGAIVGDVTRLRQILLNLLSNAVKFTERGEVVLSVSARRLDGPTPLDELTFSVRDTGIGIPADRVGRLFQSFSQVDASTTRRYGGTGLGLAISQRLTELMGGQIGVTSEVGAGSDFRFTIRAAPTEAPLRAARRDLSGVQPPLRDRRVLVVDDNATNRRILTAHLDAWGMRPQATESPGEALRWIRADERFDLGILDMHMPEMDGVALARAIREHPATATLPLVLFTSLGRREARVESEGFAAYLHKPIKPSQLFDALVSVLAEQPVHVREREVVRSDLAPDMAQRHPLRILLAEDNVVNQKVALRLLAQMGYRADVAGNGLEAIDAIERQTYDVVLMDVQMPELDGFEASREINRRWPGERRPRIVAMTANAMQGDRELCVAAGMDDYVAKPIRVEELVSALERCPARGDAGPRGAAAAARRGTKAARRPRPSRQRPEAPGAAPPAPETAVIDRSAIERLTASMGGAFVAELIDTFGADARELVATLRRGLADGDVDVFRRAAHSLKSTSETLGAPGLAALARDLEARARAGSLEGVEGPLEQLVGLCETVVHTLGELRRDLPR